MLRMRCMVDRDGRFCRCFRRLFAPVGILTCPLVADGVRGVVGVQTLILSVYMSNIIDNGRTVQVKAETRRNVGSLGQTSRGDSVPGTGAPPSEENQNGVRISLPLASPAPGDYPSPTVLADAEPFTWNDDEPLVTNHLALGGRLAQTGDLYRQPGYAGGLLLAPDQPNIEPKVIQTGKQVASIIADRLRVFVMKNGKLRGNSISLSHLDTVLRSEVFLQQFRPLDGVVKMAQYAGDFELIRCGYNDYGPGQRFLYVGPSPVVARSPDAIRAFLDVMAFSTNSDRTNAVAAALTVLLRNYWAGAKPVLVVTSTKSHGGKDTVILFARGRTPGWSISYESTDWAFQKAVVAGLNQAADTGVIIVENVRLERHEKQIGSGFLERWLTDPAPLLYSPGRGDPVRVQNHQVVAISTNYGTVSEDLMNRALPIHLTPVGDVYRRKSPVGNPKLEYLPANRERIEAELLGMVERWREAGSPLDTTVQHPFTGWAQTIGGILHVNGFTDFLANYAARKTADDPVRRALGQMGARWPDEWLRVDEWARTVVTLGLAKAVVPPADQENDVSRARGIGVVLSAHIEETFVVETDDGNLTLKLEKARRRFQPGQDPTVRYRFRVMEREPLAVVNAPAQ
jgi:hypothetical protein